MKKPPSLWRAASVALAIACALFVTYVYPRHNGLDLDLDNSALAQESRRREPYDLAELQVLKRAVLEVKKNYVEPQRIDWRRMLLSGLNAIQRSVAPVLVHYEDGADTFRVQVQDKAKTFSLKEVDSPWSVSERFAEVFQFIQSPLASEDVDLREVEYAAVNGMLRTLDPHTVLLTPNIYEDMRASTRGEFGGLGIVISIRDDQLTVIQPMDNTPASRAGLHKGDKIVRIDDEGTLNMPLNEAVDRLRGTPGSKVTVWITREGKGGFKKARPFELTRAVIHIPSVESRMLTKGIGYIQIKSFQGNTQSDMEDALEGLHREGLKGLVLDLRDDPGGLLDQAVKVADTFLSSGTIVTTSSNDPRERDEKFAKADGTEPEYPMVVLVNGRSASASEIVAGALKAHDRALIVGQRTFGKGPVQVLYDFRDGSALKLTIAQYLTPGDISIQEVGIVPDIAIDPMTVDKEDMDLTMDTGFLRESDLGRHLTSDRVRTSEQPQVTLRYYLPKETRRRLQEAAPEDREENEKEEEFLLRFAQELIADAKGSSGRVELLANAQQAIETVRKGEMAKAVADLRALGVDWSIGEDRGPSELKVEVSTTPADQVTADQPFSLTVRLTNIGKAPLYQLRAKTKSDYGLFNERELVFGRLKPGQTREWSTTLGQCETKKGKRECSLPAATLSRADGIRIEFEEAHGHAPPTAEVRTLVAALPRPRFAYAVRVMDREGNGDGRVQKGEHVTLLFRLRNVGEGDARKTTAVLRNLSGRGITLRDGRFTVDGIAQGSEEEIAFTFDVAPDFDGDTIELEVAAMDTELREGATEKVEIPIESAIAVTDKSETAVFKEGTRIYTQPDPKSDKVADVQGGSVALKVTGAAAGFVRVDLGDDKTAWIPKSDAASGASAKAGEIVWTVNHLPPRLTVDYRDTLVTRDRSLAIEGKATDEQHVRDLYVFVGSRKVFYKSSGKNTKAIEFKTKVPLRPGINYVTVFAREAEDVVTRSTFVVRRDGPDGSLLDTPRHSDDPFLDDDEDLLLEE